MGRSREVANARAVAVHVVTGVAVFAVLAEEHVVLAQHRHLVGQQLRQRRRWHVLVGIGHVAGGGHQVGDAVAGLARRGADHEGDELLVVAAAQMGRVQAGPQRCRHGQRNRSPSRRRGRCRRESASPRTAGGVAPVHFLAGPVGALHRAHRQVERAAVQLVAADVLDRLGFHPAREIPHPHHAGRAHALERRIFQRADLCLVQRAGAQPGRSILPFISAVPMMRRLPARASRRRPAGSAVQRRRRLPPLHAGAVVDAGVDAVRHLMQGEHAFFRVDRQGHRIPLARQHGLAGHGLGPPALRQHRLQLAPGIDIQPHALAGVGIPQAHDGLRPTARPRRPDDGLQRHRTQPREVTVAVDTGPRAAVDPLLPSIMTPLDAAGHVRFLVAGPRRIHVAVDDTHEPRLIRPGGRALTLKAIVSPPATLILSL